MIIHAESDIASLFTYLDSIEDLLVAIDFKLGKLGNAMDKKIKSAKKVMDKKMNALVKEDIKRDKKCEYDEKMAKKKK